MSKTLWPVALWLVLASAVGEPHLRVLARLPHDPAAYTQGLLFADGVFYESTGLNGQSSLRRVDPESGRVLQRRDLDPAYFGEGLALVGDTLIQLTWRAGKAFVYDRRSFERLREFDYEGEGWGLTYDGRRLIMSDGSDKLYFRDPDTFRVENVLAVSHNGRPVRYLNELEYVEGEIWANVYGSDYVLRISPQTGAVLGGLNLKGLVAPAERNGREDVLNGIAYDPQNKRLFVTGKRYSYVYEIATR